MSISSNSTSLQVLITCDSDITLWQLSGRQRLQKQFAQFSDITLVDEPSQCQSGVPLLLIRGDFVYVQKLIKALKDNTAEFVLTDNNEDEAVAIYLSSYDSLQDKIEQLNSNNVPAGIQRLKVQEFVKPYDAALRKYEAVEIYKITTDNRTQLEDFLFGNSYKGVTDFVTKFIWPYPAKWVTRLCTQHSITPNQVTLFGLALVIITGFLFWHGWFMTGLLLGWLMTFLDTVDGKLARVTISSSKIGHILDHGMDIIHPPIWYYAWGMGLINLGLISDTFVVLMWCMFVAYVGGRVIEGIFELFTPITIFTWRRFDSFNRLVTARRNPNMVLLTCFTILGQPIQGLYAVVIWHIVSTLVLIVRFGQVLHHRKKGDPIDSWLANIESSDNKMDLAGRLFAKTAALK